MAASTIERTSSLPGRQVFPGLALLALVSTILLITMGSIVRVTGHGLGCPDWPLCYGRVIPPALTGAWVEFSHRLLGAAAGAQILLLAFLAWRGYRDRPWVFWPALVSVALLIIQVSLGGLHVIFEIPPVTGWVHTGVAMLIVGVLAVQVAGAQPTGSSPWDATLLWEHRFRVWLSAATAATYLLILTGSYVTRSGASLACPSFPLCGSDAPAMRRLIDIQMLHRFAAFSVAFLAIVLVFWLVARGGNPRLARYGYGVTFLLALQFGLGISNVLLRLPMWSRVLHLAVAASLWASLVVLWSLSRSRQPVPHAAAVTRK